MSQLKAPGLKIKILFFLILFSVCVPVYSQNIKEPDVAGKFYPDDKAYLRRKIENFFNNASPQEINGEIFCLISPHAGYDFSGQTAAFGYKLIKDKPYRTIVIIGPSHYYPFDGVSVYQSGKFRTPLGDVEIDEAFVQKLLGVHEKISFLPQAFEKEHSVEVQIPFLQVALSDFKIVPVIAGQCEYSTLKAFARLLSSAIGARKDVLVIASTDLYHGYDWQEAKLIDSLTISYVTKMSGEDIFDKLKDGTIQMCGGLAVVPAVLSAAVSGHKKAVVLSNTNSAEVTGNKQKGIWTVGYLSAVIDQPKSGGIMLDTKQKKRLLEIAHQTIKEYVLNSKICEFKEDDPVLNEICGVFVTLHKDGELRGCIGNMVGQKPLYLTVRDMAIESAANDPRFKALSKDELDKIDIEISVLSKLKKIKDISEFQIGVHGAIVKKGWNQGVFLPQVATETGWTTEEFFSNLCAHKAGIESDAWKNKDCEVYIFSANVFSEKEAL